MQDEFRDRFVRLEVEVKKDNQHLLHEIAELKSAYVTLSKEFHISRGELKSVAELYQLYHKLTERIERDSEKRDLQHKELLEALSKKLDAGAPAKWAFNFQKIIQWIMWFIMFLGAFGVGNWMKDLLFSH